MNNQVSAVLPSFLGVDEFPVVYVETDGSVREVTTRERRTLCELRAPFDGDRPYVKSSYECSKYGMHGYLRRENLPRDKEVKKS